MIAANFSVNSKTVNSTAPVPSLQMRFIPGLEDDAHPPVRQPLQALHRQRGAQDVPAQPLQRDPLRRRQRHVRVEVVALIRRAPRPQRELLPAQHRHPLHSPARPLSRGDRARHRRELQNPLRVVVVLHVVLGLPREPLLPKPPLARQPHLHHQRLDVVRRRRRLEEAQRVVRAAVEHAIEVDHVKVKVQVKC